MMGRWIWWRIVDILSLALAGKTNGGLKITVQVHSLSANIGNDDSDLQAFFVGRKLCKFIAFAYLAVHLNQSTASANASEGLAECSRTANPVLLQNISLTHPPMRSR